MKHPLKLGMALPDISLHGDSILLYELYGIESYAALIDSGGNVRLFDRYERKGLVRHHHSAIHLPSAGKVIFFGGYGNRKYFNTFTCFDYRRREWTDLEFSGDTISPRFFAASAVSPDEKTVYIYGGKGNAIGSQDIGTTYYHDLYKLNLDSMTIRRLWTAQEPESEFVPTRNMVLSGNILYALVYPEFNPSSQLQLIELDIADGSMHAVGDTIPIISEEIATNAYLAYNSNRSQLLCMVQEFEKDGSRHLRAYSLAFPPVDASALVMPANSRKSSVMTILLCVVALAFLLGGIFLFKRHSRIRQDGHACDISDRVVAAPDNHVPVPTSVPENDVPVYEDEDVPSAATEKKCNSIMLFGPFTVFDRNGREITHLFRPKIKSLFAYLLINSVGGDGVLSATISSLFWPDKDPDKVKNLRNVSVSSIRNALQNISGIELVYIGGYFRLELTDECFCDYMAMSKATGNFTYSPSDDNLDNIIKICSRGKALTSFDSPIFDEVKGDVENFLMPLLCEAAEKSFRAGHNSQTLRICNSIFSLDPLSEQGLKYAVGVWSRRKDVPQAKRVYRNFIAEYRSSFGDEYPQTFDMIVKTTSAMQ